MRQATEVTVSSPTILFMTVLSPIVIHRTRNPDPAILLQPAADVEPYR
jgi:hypothetical protein